MKRSWLAAAALIGLVGVAASCSLFCTRWRKTDEFVRGLKCGMSADDIRRYSQAFEGVSVYEPERTNLPGLVAEHSGTHVGCFFEGGKLRAVQVSWISEPMKRTTEPKRELCTSGDIGSQPSSDGG